MIAAVQMIERICCDLVRQFVRGISKSHSRVHMHATVGEIQAVNGRNERCYYFSTSEAEGGHNVTDFM